MLLENWCSLGALLVCIVCACLLAYESRWGCVLYGKSRNFQSTTSKYHRDNLLCIFFHGNEIHLLTNVLSLIVLSLFQDELVFLVRFLVYSWFGLFVVWCLCCNNLFHDAPLSRVFCWHLWTGCRFDIFAHQVLSDHVPS